MGLIDKVKGELVDLVRVDRRLPFDARMADAVEAAVASMARSGPEPERRSGLDEAVAQVEERGALLAEGYGLT